MNWIENQPVQFGVAAPCGTCDADIPQLSDNTDTIQVQFSVDDCGGYELLEDIHNYPYNTWYLADGWTLNNPDFCHSGSQVGSATVELAAGTFPDGYYKFTIVVTSFGGVGSLRIKYGVFPSYHTIGDITGVGTWIFYSWIHPAGTPPLMLLLSPSSGVEICISSIGVTNVLTNAIIAFYNSDGVYQTEISQDSDNTLFVFSDDTVTATIDWSALDVPLSNGCFYMCLLDPCLNTGGQNYQPTITNPTFAGSTTGWDDDGATYSANTVLLDGGDWIRQTIFNAYINQCVYIYVTALSGQLDIYFGTALVGTITTTGMTKICGTPVGNLSIIIVCPVYSTATLDSVQKLQTGQAHYPTGSYVCDQQSNNFKLADYSNDCTMLITASDNENGMGFIFGTGSGFVPSLRIEAKLKGMKYPSEKVSSENSDGTKSITYFNGRKAKYFCTDLQPEYIHDFLRLLFGFDNFYIDSVLYYVEDDEYNVVISDSQDNVGSVKFLVSTKTQNVKNTNCT